MPATALGRVQPGPLRQGFFQAVCSKLFVRSILEGFDEKSRSPIDPPTDRTIDTKIWCYVWRNQIPKWNLISKSNEWIEAI
jgi:hypothetical protein